MDPVSVLDLAEQSGLTQFAALARASSYESLLEGDAPLTVFAPLNASFTELAPGKIQSLFEPANLAELDLFVSYHISQGAQSSASLGALDQISMVGSDDAYVDALEPALWINDAQVLESFEDAENGVLYSVSRVLQRPQSVLDTLEDRGFDTALELIGLSGLGGSVMGGQMTLFVPSDAAFAALDPAELDALRDPAQQAALVSRLELHLVAGRARASDFVANHHVLNLADSYLFFDAVSGAAPTANDQELTRINLRCTDGTIHVTDSVFSELPTIDAIIQDSAAQNGIQTLSSLIFAGGLTSDLALTQPLTVFAPSDSGLANGLPAGTIDALVDPANIGRLQAFLRSHMVAEALSYPALTPGTMLTTVQGDTIDVTGTAGAITLDGMAPITVRNLYAKNGVLHVIEGVLDDGL